MRNKVLERNTFAILFYIRNDKVNKNGEAPVYMRITIDKVKAEYATGERITPHIWNEGRIKGNSASAKRVKETMDILRGRVMEIRNNYNSEEEPITARYIVDTLNGKITTKAKSKSVMEVFKLHNGMVYNLIGIDYAQATYTRYETTKKHITEYMLKNYKVSDMLLTRLDYEFIKNFDIYMKLQRKCSNNTTIKYIKMFKVITNYAIKHDWLDKDPFKLFECKLEKIEKEYLTDDEIDLIIYKEFDSERLDNVRNIFLFSIFTGLAYVDVAKLTSQNIKIGVNGLPWLFSTRTKTGIVACIPLLPLALEILDRYKEYPLCETKGTLLPVPTNQKTNEYLKEIATVCGIKKNLTFHMARHTFATTIMAGNDVEPEIVKPQMGHTDIRTTQIYTHKDEYKIAKAVEPLYKKYVRHLKNISYKPKN